MSKFLKWPKFIDKVQECKSSATVVVILKYWSIHRGHPPSLWPNSNLKLGWPQLENKKVGASNNFPSSIFFKSKIASNEWRKNRKTFHTLRSFHVCNIQLLRNSLMHAVGANLWDIAKWDVDDVDLFQGQWDSCKTGRKINSRDFCFTKRFLI